MASKDNRASRKTNLPKLTRKDRQVTPLENDGGGGGEGRTTGTKIKTNDIKTFPNAFGGIKRTEREIKEVEEKRMKAIAKDNKRIKRKMLRKHFRKDIVQTTSETCATFCFVFIVGSLLLGGGTALIFSGKENDVFDFIVVGAVGLVCGTIFTVTGVSIFMKPIYERHLARKEAQVNSWNYQDPEGPAKPSDQSQENAAANLYLNQSQAKTLKSEIKDRDRQNRSPSDAELYGDDASFDNVNSITTPRDESFTSHKNPPFLAVPNHEKESSQKKPVLLLDAKERMSPTKGVGSKNKSSSALDNNETHSKMTIFSVENETNSSKTVSFSAEYDDSQRYHLDPDNYDSSVTENSGLDRHKSDEVPSSIKKEKFDLDKILRHASRSTVVIDYSLLDDLDDSGPRKTTPSNGGGENVNQFRNSHNSRKDIGSDTQFATHPGTNEEHQRHSELTDKLYQKHPEIADKHHKRSKKHRSKSRPKIMIPLDDSDMEETESRC